MKCEFFAPSGETVGRIALVGQPPTEVILSKVRKGECFYLESSEDGTPSVSIRSSIDGVPSWEYSLVDLNFIKKMAKDPSAKKTQYGFFTEFLMSFDSTAKSMQLGEKPSYLLLKATDDNSKITIGAHKHGRILLLQASNMPMLVRKGGFLVGQMGIIIDQFIITGENSQLISQLLGSRFFQEISGRGFYCLEIEGTCSDVPHRLPPGGHFEVEASHLIAMTKSIRISGVSKISDDKNIRDSVGTNYALTLEANSQGGYVFTSSTSQKPKKKQE